jgi:hypothetical protein
MAADETIGVAAAARLLRRLSEAREATVAEQAKELGIRRSTAFVLAAGLEATGLGSETVADDCSLVRPLRGSASPIMASARWRMRLKRCFLYLGTTRTRACL